MWVRKVSLIIWGEREREREHKMTRGEAVVMTKRYYSAFLCNEQIYNWPLVNVICKARSWPALLIIVHSQWTCWPCVLSPLATVTQMYFIDDGHLLFTMRCQYTQTQWVSGLVMGPNEGLKGELTALSTADVTVHIWPGTMSPVNHRWPLEAIYWRLQESKMNVQFLSLSLLTRPLAK